MQFGEFHNGLRIMMSIDQDELVSAGIIRANDHNAWGEFRRDPFRWFIRASDDQAKKLWTLMQKRMVPRRSKLARSLFAQTSEK